MKSIWIITVLLSLVLGACNAGPMSVDPPYGPPCPADLRFQVEPDDHLSLLPEETVQASYKVFGCGGTQELDVTPIWVSADTNVATVSDTGLITAQQGGNTEITVSEEEYNTGFTIQVSVAIVEPAP